MTVDQSARQRQWAWLWLRAQRVVAGAAVDAADARELLEALGMLTRTPPRYQSLRPVAQPDRSVVHAPVGT